MAPSISLCMVVKDEAETLAGAIESMDGIVDEIVIGVDDSCTDNTAEIAKRYASAGKYFEFTWRDDFSWARNEAIKRCDGDYIFILDGHEFLPPDEHPIAMQMARMRHIDVYSRKVLTPRSFMEQIHEKGMQDDYDVVCKTLCMNTDRWGIPQLFFLQPRMFRNGMGIQYKSAVHNHLHGYRREAAMGCPEGILVHNMPDKREQMRKGQRKVMNFSGLMADVREERKKPLAEQNGRPWFYMANSHADMGNAEKAIYWYEQYLNRSLFGEELYQAHQQLAVLYMRHRKDFTKAKYHGLRAMELQYARSEPLILLGEIASDNKQYDEAHHWFSMARNVPAPHTVMFCQGPVYSYLPDIQRMRAYEAQGNMREALRFAEAAYSWRPNDGSLFEKIEELRNSQKTASPTHRPNMIIVDSLGSFSKDIANHMGRSYDVRVMNAPDEKEKAWADVAWFEWCDQNIIKWSREQWSAPIICRLHSYEAFTDMPAQVEWNNVKHLVFVADHIRELFFLKWPHLRERIETSIIPNGVDMNRWTYRKRGHGKRIGYVGYLNPKKGIDLLLLFAHMLPEYEFHIVGRMQDNHIAYDFSSQVAELPNVWYQDHIPNEQMNDWMDNIDYLLSPSVVESFGYSIAEAMAKGIKPLIRSRAGAIWGDTWRTPEDLLRMIDPNSPYESQEYRDHIHNYYRLEIQTMATERLVKYVMNDTRENVKDAPYLSTMIELPDR
jgi:glycosyltransferase involved in cell wall biosynthesis